MRVTLFTFVMINDVFDFTLFLTFKAIKSLSPWNYTLLNISISFQTLNLVGFSETQDHKVPLSVPNKSCYVFPVAWYLCIPVLHIIFLSISLRLYPLPLWHELVYRHSINKAQRRLAISRLTKLVFGPLEAFFRTQCICSYTRVRVILRSFNDYNRITYYFRNDTNLM